MAEKILCPICEEGHLQFECEELEAEYRGQKMLLPSHFSVCNSCGSETATAEQTRENKRGMIAFKKEVDGFLTGREILALRKQLGVTQNQAANVFGGGPVAFSKYENDDVTQSESMDKLLRAASKFPMVMVWLAKEAGEDEVAKRLVSERFPCFDMRPFVAEELKVSGGGHSIAGDNLRYLKLDNSVSINEETLNVG